MTGQDLEDMAEEVVQETDIPDGTAMVVILHDAHHVGLAANTRIHTLISVLESALVSARKRLPPVVELRLDTPTKDSN